MYDFSNVSINLVAVRANARMSQAEWAEQLGVNITTVVSWEKGKSEPTLSQLRAMSELSGIPISMIRTLQTA